MVTESLSVVRRTRFAAATRVAGWASAIGLLLIFVVVFLAPVLAQYSPIELVGPARTAPNGEYLFGTDQLGRDVFSRTLYGGRNTIGVTLISTAFASIAGVVVGVIAGYFSGWFSSVLMRVIDITLAFPVMLLALLVIAVGGSNLTTLTVAVSLAYIPSFARIVYGSTRRWRGREFVLAAKLMGARPARVIANHIVRPMLVELIVLASSAIGWTVLLTAGLSFLGFGVVPPDPEWGASLASGIGYLDSALWISMAPGIAITLVILLSNLVGDRVAAMSNSTGRRSE